METSKPNASVFIPDDHSYGEVRVRFPYLDQAYGFMDVANAILRNAILRNAEEPKEPEDEQVKNPKKVLVIDDSQMMKDFVEKFCYGCEVEQIHRLPDSFWGLDKYDAIIVDGHGIGNAIWKNGMEFLRDYEKPEGQSVVYYSGCGAYGEERDMLEAKGVAVVTKGSNPEKLWLAVRFPMSKQSKFKQFK